MHKETLLSYVIALWAICIIFLIVFGIIIATLSKKPKFKNINKLLIVILVIIILFCIYKTVLCIIDISQELYIVEENVIYFYERRQSVIEHISITTSDGRKISLHGSFSYPYGTYKGNVTYAKYSKIILDFHETEN